MTIFPDDFKFLTYDCLNDDDQYWYMYLNDGTNIMLRNKYTGSCLFQNKDTRFGVADCNSDNVDQYFRIITSLDTQLPSGKYFQLKGKQSGECIFQNSDGRFDAFSCSNYDDQFWELDAVNDIYFR